jgi:hypothetical protein
MHETLDFIGDFYSWWVGWDSNPRFDSPLFVLRKYLQINTGEYHQTSLTVSL